MVGIGCEMIQWFKTAQFVQGILNKFIVSGMKTMCDHSKGGRQRKERIRHNGEKAGELGKGETMLLFWL